MQTQNAIFLTALQHFSSFITFTDSTKSLNICTYPSPPPVPVPVSAKEVDALDGCESDAEKEVSGDSARLFLSLDSYTLVTFDSPSTSPLYTNTKGICTLLVLTSHRIKRRQLVLEEDNP